MKFVNTFWGNFYQILNKLLSTLAEMSIAIDKENFNKYFIRNIDTHRNTARTKSLS